MKSAVRQEREGGTRAAKISAKKFLAVLYRLCCGLTIVLAATGVIIALAGPSRAGDQFAAGPFVIAEVRTAAATAAPVANAKERILQAAVARTE